MFNVVTGKEGQAHAVLIRALEPVEGIEVMMKRRKFLKQKSQLTAGPGVMSKAMGINIGHTGLSLVDEDSPIWIEDRKVSFSENLRIL